MIQQKIKISKKKKEALGEKIVTGLLFLFLAFGIFVLLFTAKSIFLPQKTISNQVSIQTQSNSIQRLSMMGLTGYDKKLALEFMDKNGDGMCDVCGMDVNICIESGQLQCNMDSESTIGVLGSQHIHADWKVYINGNALDFTGKDHMGRMRDNLPVSSFIHVDSGAPAPEKTGDLLHMHATGVPLWIFFESIELELPNNVETYANGKKILDYRNYVFNDLDKILITDGKGDLQKHLDSVTDFAKNH